MVLKYSHVLYPVTNYKMSKSSQDTSCQLSSTSALTKTTIWCFSINMLSRHGQQAKQIVIFPFEGKKMLTLHQGQTQQGAAGREHPLPVDRTWVPIAPPFIDVRERVGPVSPLHFIHVSAAALHYSITLQLHAIISNSTEIYLWVS